MMFALIRYQTSMSFEEWCKSCMVDQNVTWAETPMDKLSAPVASPMWKSDTMSHSYPYSFGKESLE